MKQIIILMTITAALVVSLVTIAEFSSRQTPSNGQKVRLEIQKNENSTADVRRADTGREDAMLSLLWASVALVAVWLGGRRNSGRLALAHRPHEYRSLPHPDRRFDSMMFGERPTK